MSGLDRLVEKQNEPKGVPGYARPRRPTPEPSTARKRSHDSPVMLAARHFAKRAEGAGLQLAKPAAIIYYDIDARVNQSGLRKLDLAWSDGKKVWPDLLLGMVDEFFATEYRHGDRWAWQDFCGVETFTRLRDRLVFRLTDQRDRAAWQRNERMNAELQAGWDEIASAMRSENTQRHAEDVTPEVTPVAPMSAEELFGDDLDEYRRLRDKRLGDGRLKHNKRIKHNPNRATEEDN